MMLEKSLITAAWAEVEILAAGDANALAIVATNAFAIDFEVDGFEQNRVEIDRIVLVGDGIEVVFFEDDFVGVADAPRIDEFEDGMEFEFAFESFATTVARELEICTDVGVEVDELCVCKELGIVLNGAKHGAFVGIVEILDESWAAISPCATNGFLLLILLMLIRIRRTYKALALRSSAKKRPSRAAGI